ncbi:MAG TPA: hypothetical protein VE963_18070, partial [Reyranella sp.]|nr:hypothetical protein [Reyranella sp.]
MDPYANPDPYARRGFDDGGTTGDSTTTQPPLQTGYMQRVDPRLAFGGIDPSQLQRAEQYRQDAINDRKKQEAARQDAESKEQYNADQMSTILDQATAAIKKSREGRSNLALMTLGANMMGPGNFGDQLGRGLRAMVPAIQKQREEDTQEEITLANLGVKRWDMQNAPLKTKLDYLRAMEKGDIDTQRAIELAQLKTGSAEQIAREKLAAQPPKALGGGVFWDPHTKQLQRVGLLGVTDVNSANQRTGALAGTLQDVPSTPIEGAGVDRSRDDKTFGTGQGGYNEEFMKQLETQNPGVAAMVKALARGEKQFPGDRGKWSQDQSDLLALVKEYDPSFNTMDYNARSKTLQSFTSGDDAKAIAALKLAISHMGSLHHAAGALDGGDIQSINAVKNWFKTQFGSSDVTNFNAIAHPVAEEIARV